MKPQRIQLSRAKGWRMQAVSKALNGLQCVKVDRSTKWGNPFRRGGLCNSVDSSFHCETAQEAVDAFRSIMTGCAPAFLARDLPELRGKNLACWCKITDEHGKRVPCHADVLLELANK